jgi:3-phytase
LTSSRLPLLAGLIVALLAATAMGSLSPSGTFVGKLVVSGGDPTTPEPAATATVLPTVETSPSHHSGDTADDMAIWIHPTDPSLSLIIGDDKDGGLMVWDLEGHELQYIDGTLYNNVDLRYNFPIAGTYSSGGSHTQVALVGVSDEGGSQFDFFKVNPNTRRLEPAGSVGIPTQPYGGCMYVSPTTGKYHFIAPDHEGVTVQVELRDGGNGQVAGTLVRQFDVGGITEGCVADDRLGHLYMGEEDAGIWKYGAEPSAGAARTQVDATGSGNLVADVEGLAIFYAGTDRGYLIASSQGDSMVVVYDRAGSNQFLHRFHVGANGAIDDVGGSDGLDITNFPLGTGFSVGLLAIHDADNEGGSASNVKLVPFGSIVSALGLISDTTWDPRLVGGGPAQGPTPPSAGFAFAPVAPRVGDLVSFDGSPSSSSPGTSLEYRWDWEGDGIWDTAWSASPTAGHVFEAAHTYMVILEVRDSSGQSDTENLTVVVLERAVQPDTIPPSVTIASPADESVLTSQTVTISGTAADDRGVQIVELSVDGTTWTAMSGTTSWSGTISLGPGSHTIYVRGTDTGGNRQVVTIKVVIESDSNSPVNPVEPNPFGLIPRGLPILLGIAAALVGLALSIALVARRSDVHRGRRRGHRTRGR